MSTNILEDLAVMLRTDWADIPALDGVRVIATERQLGVPTVPTALLRRKSLTRLPQAPQSHRRHGILLTLISAFEDMDKAADELDTIVPAALDYFDTRFQSETATSVLYIDRLAYDIPLTVIASKE